METPRTTTGPRICVHREAETYEMRLLGFVQRVYDLRDVTTDAQGRVLSWGPALDVTLQRSSIDAALDEGFVVDLEAEHRRLRGI